MMYRELVVVNEQNNPNRDPAQQGLSSTDDRSAIPLGQQPPIAGVPSQSGGSGQSQGDQPQGQQTSQQPQEHAGGAIPKAVEAVEKAADKGLEKTSGVVGSTIDKVADAAISALGGKPNHDNNS